MLATDDYAPPCVSECTSSSSVVGCRAGSAADVVSAGLVSKRGGSARVMFLHREGGTREGPSSLARIRHRFVIVGVGPAPR
jgi:hypothetical protein